MRRFVSAALAVESCPGPFPIQPNQSTSMSPSTEQERVDREAVAASDEEEAEEVEVEAQGKSQAEESSALEKLTDVVEEKQMDENKMKEAFLALTKQEEADKEAERRRDRALAAIKVRKEDVELVAREMELSPQQADRSLREAGGDVAACLQALVAC